MTFNLKRRNLFLCFLTLVFITGCNQANSSKVTFYSHYGAEWDGSYKGIEVEGVTAQSYDNEDGSVYVIVRGRLVNTGVNDYNWICVWVSLESKDNRLGGESETCDRLASFDRKDKRNFEVRIDNPTHGKWYIEFAISGN